MQVCCSRACFLSHKSGGVLSDGVWPVTLSRLRERLVRPSSKKSSQGRSRIDRIHIESGIMSLLEMFVYMDMSAVTSMSVDSLLEVFSVDPLRDATESPAEISFREYLSGDHRV